MHPRGGGELAETPRFVDDVVVLACLVVTVHVDRAREDVAAEREASRPAVHGPRLDAVIDEPRDSCTPSDLFDDYQAHAHRGSPSLVERDSTIERVPSTVLT